jgi:hypothetical protein
MLRCVEQRREPGPDELSFAGIDRDDLGHAPRTLVHRGIKWVAGISDDGRGG